MLAQTTSAPGAEGGVVQSSSTTPTLDEQIRAAAREFKGEVRLFAKNLDTGEIYGLGEDERVRTASTIKVPIMVEAFASVAEGRASWDHPLLLTREEKVGGSGILSEFHDGLELTLRDAVNLMIVVSDNSATNLVLDVVTTDSVNNRMETLGLKETRVLRKIGGRGGESRAGADPSNRAFGLGVATAREMVLLLEKLDRGEIVNKEASAEMIALLKRQQDRRGIARSLRNIKVASKAGALDRLRSDIGIAYTKGGRIAMAITCDGMPETIWNDDNPGYLLLSRLSVLLVEGLRSDR